MWSLGRRFAERLGQYPWRMAASEAFSKCFFVTKSYCAFHVIDSYFLGLSFMMGPSMLPTINLTGDVFAVNKVASWRGELKSGDVVLMISPENPRKIITKRIMGIEGERVTYRVDPANSEMSKTVVVPIGHVWVQGDNIYSSNDSRNFGPAPRGLVKGRVFFRVWPPESIGRIDSKVNQYEPPTN